MQVDADGEGPDKSFSSEGIDCEDEMEERRLLAEEE